MISATVLAHSETDYHDKTLVTFELVYPRIVHQELGTHRSFCISGDSTLDFELPAGNHGASSRRIYSMSLRSFADKWFNGSAEGRTPAHNGKNLDTLEKEQIYSAREIAAHLGFSKALNLNDVCRKGLVDGAVKTPDRQWTASGAAWTAWRKTTGTRKFSLRSRLARMQIRQVDQKTGDVQLSSVVNCVVSGVKPVLRISAGKFSVVATAEHRVFTTHGWKTIAELVPGVDAICTYRYGSGAQENPYNRIDGEWVCRWSRKVRDEVAERQGRVCAHTGDPLEPSFHIHHVIPRHQRPDLAFDLENVVAVNEQAHREIHKKQGWQMGVALGSQYLTLDSIEEAGTVDTYDLEIAGEFPNFFANGVVVHNSRNSASSRAIPIAKMIEQIETNPFVPQYIGRNQPGMQSLEDLPPKTVEAAKQQWLTASKAAIFNARKLAELGVHKQIANRLLEPFQWMQTVLTGTEFDNFFELRCHPDAEPHFQELAGKMKDALNKSVPMIRGGNYSSPDAWHLPYISPAERASGKHVKALIKSSVARCARVSYLRQGQAPDFEKDVDLFDRLVGSKPLHASPLEHQAIALERRRDRSNNFYGWRQYRELFEAGDY